MAVVQRLSNWLGAERRSALRQAAVCAGIVCLMLLVSCAVQGIYPFGDRALSYDDGPIQYAGMHGWYHRVLTGQANLQYSFATALGGGTFPLFSYYLASPFSLLAAFFDTRDAMRLLSILWPLKLTLASFTCAYYLRRRFRLSLSANLALSASYIFAPWVLISGTCIMWLDGVYLLPVICLGVWKLIRGESCATLFWSIGCSVLFNWYAGYMCCAFAVLMFFADLVAVERPAGLSIPRVCLRFFATLMLGVGLGGVMLLTTVRSLSNGTTSNETSGLKYFLSTFSERPVMNDPIKLLSLFAINNAGQNELDLWLVLTYPISIMAVSGVLLAGVFAVPLDRSRTRAKVAWMVLLLCFLLCLVFTPLNLIVTGLTLAESYVPRFMFLILMAMVHCTAIALELPEGAPRPEPARWRMTVTSGVVGLLVILFLPPLVYPQLGPQLPWRIIEFVVAAGALVLFVLAGVASDTSSPAAKGRRSLAFGVAATVLVLVPCVNIAITSFDFSSTTTISAREEYFDDRGDLLVSGIDADFFRAETTDVGSTAVSFGTTMYNATTTDNFGLGVNGLGHYSSISYQAISNLLGKLGYCNTPAHRNMTWYSAPLLATDSLLGIRYVLTDVANPPGLEYQRDVTMPKVFGPGWALYENPYALPIGYGVYRFARTVPWGHVSDWGWDSFINTDKLYTSLVGRSVQLYTVGTEEHVIPVKNTNSKHSITYACWQVVAPADGPLYLASAFPTNRRVKVYADGVFVRPAGGWNFDTYNVYLGEHAAGDVITIEVLPEYPEEGTFKTFNSAVVPATLDMDVFKELNAELAARPFQARVIRDGYIEGTYVADGTDSLLLTVPFDVSWRVTVDDQPVQQESLNGLTLIRLEPGEHTIKMSYLTSGLKLGLLISGGSLLLFLAWRLLLRWHDRRRALAA